MAAGDRVTPYSGRGHPSKPPHGAGAEDVGLRNPPHRHGPLRARRAGHRPKLHSGVRRVIGAAVVSTRPHRRALRQDNQSNKLIINLHAGFPLAFKWKIKPQDFVAKINKIKAANEMHYQWSLAAQPRVVERRLQVRRHAVDEVAVGALP